MAPSAKRSLRMLLKIFATMVGWFRFTYVPRIQAYWSARSPTPLISSYLNYLRSIKLLSQQKAGLDGLSQGRFSLWALVHFRPPDFKLWSLVHLLR
ncbi:hypothetical protein I7I48_10551 [Histoplasma ohiense]|nr:hypothetical protein I7I48_10551 [Histoplasma ohiense (nom. inval.)]